MKARSVLSALVVLGLMLALVLPALAGGGKGDMVATTVENLQPDRRFNILRAIGKFNGMVLKQGEVFSFNDLVGPRSYASGFRKVNDERGEAIYGGGVSQIASTIDIALQAYGSDIHMLERHTYGSEYIDTYLPSGENAVRVEYAAGLNYAFTNNVESMQFELWIDGGNLFCFVHPMGGRSKTPEHPPQYPDLPPPKLSGSFYAHLTSFDPGSGIAYFDDFEMLKGKEAYDYLTKELKWNAQEADALVSGFADSEFVERNNNKDTLQIKVDQMNFILMYQNDGTPMGGAEGVPANGDDFRLLWKNRPDLLLETVAFRLHTDGDGRVNLVEQMYWP